jgi:prepilin-type processing-associated H-X9-DG protein
MQTVRSAQSGDPSAKDLLQHASIPLFHCPSDPGAVPGTASYCGNAGTGTQRSGMNGMFRYIDGFRPWEEGGVVRAMDVRDGLSRTASVAEVLVGDESVTRPRSGWGIPEQSGPNELDAFAAACRLLPSDPARSGLSGGPGPAGRDWTDLNLGPTLYNHVNPPNTPLCINGTQYQLGSFAAGSLHAGGAHVLYGDGHAEFVSESIDLAQWRQLGSRAGGPE